MMQGRNIQDAGTVQLRTDFSDRTSVRELSFSLKLTFESSWTASYSSSVLDELSWGLLTVHQLEMRPAFNSPG